MLALLLPFIKDVVLPEVMNWIHHQHETTGRIPTLAEAQALVERRAADIIANGEAFLALANPQKPQG